MPASIWADRWMPSIHRPGGGASAGAGVGVGAAVAAAGAVVVAAGAAAGGAVCADAVPNPAARVAAAATHAPCQSLFVVICLVPS